MIRQLTRDDSAYQDALAFLYGRLNYERLEVMPYSPAELKLERMRRLLELLGNPQRAARIVHVAGTKGKGSTSHFLSAILTSAGYRTGCYTSPHLMTIEERFAVDGEPCSRGELVHWVQQMREAVARIDHETEGQAAGGPTFFELATAIGFLHFQARGTDLIVLEVGLGGRLDSTNVCEPCVSVITSISFDHMRQLGNTLSAIAREKAGIIKPGVPVVSGVTHPEPAAVIEQIAAQQGAPLRRLGRDFDFVYHPPDGRHEAALPRMDYVGRQARSGALSPEPVVLGALGAHQAANASLAWAACECLQEQGVAVPEAAIRRGLASGRCPARIEVLSQRPTRIVDTAHNAASIEALLRVLRESFPQRPRTLILAATQGKDVDGMLHALVPEFDTILCTQYLKNPRGMPAAELLRSARRIATAEGSPVDLFECPSPEAAWLRAEADTGDNGLICATGSFFLAAEIQALVESPTAAQREP
jgi:dihydrofolate synthase/folylpolyglutamate synthase